jgi:hypothetical protein
MDNTTYWLIALTVGLVGFMIYVFITLAKMQEDIDVAGILATISLLDREKTYTEADLEKLIKDNKSGDNFTNTNVITSSKKLFKK